MIQLNRVRVCLCYIISTLLITIFVFSLISNNIENTRKLDRLREDIDEIALIVLHTPSGGKSSQSLSQIVDDMVKKRLSGIWDELYALKKLLKGSGGGGEGLDSENSDGSGGSSAGGKVSGIGGRKSSYGNLGPKTDERVNYASDELGAKILQVKAEPVCSQSFLKSLMGMDFSSNPPVRMLKNSMEPGSCFAFKGHDASVTVQLAHEILLDQVAVQHINKQQSPTDDTSSAPKDFTLTGVRGDLSVNDLGRYRYDNAPDKLLQYFDVSPVGRYEYLTFHFETNHGHPNYTCIYRIAAYGKL